MRADHVSKRNAVVHSAGCVLVGALLALQPACKGNIDPVGGEFPRRPGDGNKPGEGKPADDASVPGVPTRPTVPDPNSPTTPPATQEPDKPGTRPPAVVDAGTTPPVPMMDASPPTEPVDTSSADKVWSPLSVMSIENPMDFGATGNGMADDLPALQATVNALPAAGGIVFFPEGKSFKKTNLLIITKSHVKLWAVNRNSEIFQAIAGQKRHQSLLCRNNTGCGFFGLKLRSDATARFDALEDNQISTDKTTLVEVVGNEVQGSAATGIFLFGSKEHYIEGNYVHHTWADHIHHTEGATNSFVWNNYIFNELPSKGDDGVACVTYGTNSTRCADMEWWKNTIVGAAWGRGYSVIGGNNINIHDNWANNVAGAGIIVASENSYNTSASQGITIANNIVQNCGNNGSHPNILISGLSSTAGPLKDIALSNNISVDAKNGPYRAEGMFENVTNMGMTSAKTALTSPTPTAASIKLEDTSVMRTRDTSHVAPEVRAGLFRIHVRRTDIGTFEQRFEYIIKGPPEIVTTYVNARIAADDHLSEQKTVDGTAYALLLTAAPISLPSTMQPVLFRELRDNDRNGKLSWLWTRVDAGNY